MEEVAPVWVISFCSALLIFHKIVEFSVYCSLSWWDFCITDGLSFSSIIFHNTEWWWGESVHIWFRWLLLLGDLNVVVRISIDWVVFQTGWLWSYFISSRLLDPWITVSGRGIGRYIPVHTILAWFPGRPAALLNLFPHYISSMEPVHRIWIVCKGVNYFQIFQEGRVQRYHRKL